MGTHKEFTECWRFGCFALTAEGRCRVLTDTRFGNRDCPFFKTGPQLAAERAASRERLRRVRPELYPGGGDESPLPDKPEEDKGGDSNG